MTPFPTDPRAPKPRSHPAASQFQDLLASAEAMRALEGLQMAAPATRHPPITGLRAWRGFRGLSQDELAKRAGIGQDTISRIEHGQRPRAATAQKLSAALDVPVHLLFSPEAE